MNALDALQHRTSSPRLMDPAPSPQQIDHLFKAAVRAADHGLLRPWRFLVIHGQARSLLGELFVAAAKEENSGFSAAQAEKLAGKPLRAPLLIVTIASPRPHPKVPEFEQALSAAAATQNMVNAAFALGIGVIWRTGAPAYQRIVKQGLGLEESEKIIGFLYIGTKTGKEKSKPDVDYSSFVREWGQDE